MISVDNILMITSILALGLTLIAYITKARILNIFIAGLYLNLAVNVITYPALLIVCLGMMMLHVYLTFWRYK